VTSQRHVGGIRNENNTEQVKTRTSENLIERYLQTDVYFNRCIIPSHNSLHARLSYWRYTAAAYYTSNMAAVTVDEPCSHKMAASNEDTIKRY